MCAGVALPIPRRTGHERATRRLYRPGRRAAPRRQPRANPAPARPLVVDEWGTFTSFAGSDGVPVGFRPTNADLPGFVYRQAGEHSKLSRLRHSGTVSLETPVV